MKKQILIIIGLILLLAACGDKTANKNTDDNAEEQRTVQKADKFEAKEIKLDDEFTFEQYDMKFKQVKVYEKKDKILADIVFDWTNNYHEYDKSSFYVISLLDVLQGDEELEEINDAWNVENKLTSDVLFQNAAGGTTQIKLTYELIDGETPLKLIITPTIDEDNPTDFNIEIN